MTLLGSIFDFRLFPEAASPYARQVDHVYEALLGFSALVTLMVLCAVLFFSIRYRASADVPRDSADKSRWRIELLTFGGPLALVVALFVWASWVYYGSVTPPADAMEIFVVGKQWMWKVQHPSGRREIDELHVPTGRPIKLVMTSQDVIHSFYLPAMRLKMDVLPDRYTMIWFTPDRPGTYRLFYAEYCGTDHSRMTGHLYVMSPAEYQRWLTPEPQAPTVQPAKPTSSAAFNALGCNQCHRTDTTFIAPRLEGLFGRPVVLADGSTVIADEQYIRESILDPAAKVVRGYAPIMPSYRGVIDDDQLRLLVLAVRALGEGQATTETKQ